MESDQRKQIRLITSRTAVLGLLLALPVVACAIAGALAIWQIGWTGWLWWIIPAFWVLTWLVSKIWRVPQAADTPGLTAGHWTPRDQRAAEIVQRYQKQLDELAPAQLTDMHFYLNQSQSLAAELSRHYHPKTSNPVNALTVPEIVAAIRLVADDLERLVLDSIPGSRLLTVGQWQALGKAPKWIRRVSNTAWAASILINPFNIARYGSSRVTSENVANNLQNEFLATVYLRFIRQVGFYLIEMNSGRLRGGADAWRNAFENNRSETSRSAGENKPAKDDAATPSMSAAPVKIVIVGQTCAGKSSLVNALVGYSASTVTPTPETGGTRAVELRLDEADTTLTLIDTPGYQQVGATRAQIKAIESALADADAIMLVMDAHTPARDSDKRLLQELHSSFDSRPQLQLPPVIGLLTHVDLLPPTMVWEPPYDNWREGSSAKTTGICGAIDYTKNVLGDLIVDCVPVCLDSAEKRRWGVVENVIPALVSQFDQARSVAIVAAFEKSLNSDRIAKLIRQATSSGKQILRAWLDERLKT